MLQVLRSLAVRIARATVSLKATLDAGFTTIRDLGTEGAGYADVGLKQAALNGGPVFKFTEAISLQVNCANQEEIDYYRRLASGARWRLAWQRGSHIRLKNGTASV